VPRAIMEFLRLLFVVVAGVSLVPGGLAEKENS
jgi:hypothetical protein